MLDSLKVQVIGGGWRWLAGAVGAGIHSRARGRVLTAVATRGGFTPDLVRCRAWTAALNPAGFPGQLVAGFAHQFVLVFCGGVIMLGFSRKRVGVRHEGNRLMSLAGGSVPSRAFAVFSEFCGRSSGVR